MTVFSHASLQAAAAVAAARTAPACGRTPANTLTGGGATDGGRAASTSTSSRCSAGTAGRLQQPAAHATVASSAIGSCRQVPSEGSVGRSSKQHAAGSLSGAGSSPKATLRQTAAYDALKEAALLDAAVTKRQACADESA
jgi:hypothetical protein